MHRKEYLLIFCILLIGLFFRIYRMPDFFIFEHDQDLFAWIAKDIIADGHFRLIGQLTSIDGLFIGPLFYYILAAFMSLFKMDPLGALIPATLVGLATVFSFYFVFSRFFGKTTGLISAFLYAASAGTSFYDHWVVPTQPVILWSIWFLYCLLSLLKQRLTVLPVIALLLGLIWHVHVALIPLIALLPVAYFLGAGDKKKPRITSKNFIFSAGIFLILTLPFWAFEIRHGFQQIQGLLASLGTERGEAAGINRLVKIFTSIIRLFWVMFYINTQALSNAALILSSLIITGLTAYLKIKNILPKKELLLLGLWVLIIVLAQQVSKRQVSEYYFLSLFPLLILIISLFLNTLSSLHRWPVPTLLASFLIVNFIHLNSQEIYQSAYLQKKAAVSYIADHIRAHDYPCAGINYMANSGRRWDFAISSGWTMLRSSNRPQEFLFTALFYPGQYRRRRH